MRCLYLEKTWADTFFCENEGLMPDQKIDNLLNLAMEATPQERTKSENLNVGFNSETQL